MAHDRQLAENNNESNERNRTSKESSGIVADWLTVFAETYREEVTEGTALLYREALKDVKPKILHKAFLRVTKTCKFRPTPAEVLEAANLELELDDSKRRAEYPIITQEERNAALTETQELRDQLRETLKKKSLPKDEAPTITQKDWNTSFTPEEWDATQKAYREYLTREFYKDQFNKANGISPIPRSREEQLAIYYNLPPQDREKIRKQVRP